MEETRKTPRQAGPWSIPNLLTYARIAVVPLVVLCFDLEERGKSKGGREKGSDPSGLGMW